MNRRELLAKIPLFGLALTPLAVPKKSDYLLNVGATMCPSCLMMFDASLRRDDRGNWTNWNPDTQEITVQHPDYAHCRNAGKIFKISFSRLPAEIK